MRLGTLFLSATLAWAQAPALPWAAARTLPWEVRPCSAPADPAGLPRPTQSAATLRVQLAVDGALRIYDHRGVLQLRTGLPGRPVKMWRDWGIALDLAAPIAPFPQQTPLLAGIGALPVAAADFRPALEGLLWILDDDEKVLTLIHPATARIAYLVLPGGRNLNLVFLPGHLEVQEQVQGPGPRVEGSCWSLSWLALLPQFIQLGQGNPGNHPQGTAILPFPKE